MPQAVRELSREEANALMAWISRHGPFWEEVRVHAGDDYLECDGEIVTDTAVGEAGFCCIQLTERALVSISPSNWERSPVSVTLVSDENNRQSVNVNNYYTVEGLQLALETAPRPMTSWSDLRNVSLARCQNLTFSADAFEPLMGYPYADGAAQRVLVLLMTLDKFKTCFDQNGERTQEGHRIYQDQFTGDKARFSDSSDAEKREFENELTFPHPERDGEFIFCPMHGKEKSNQLRIHFSWPVRLDEPLYIVYVGPKLTKR